MRQAALLFAVLGLGFFAIVPARAQIQVTTQTSRSNFLLYERVDVFVTLQNVSGRDLVLENNEGRPWLTFLVSGRKNLPIRPERDSTFATLNLKAGETKTLSVNLTPLFAFREPGAYTAAAVVDLPGAGQLISEPVPFAVYDGRKVWSQMRPVDSSQRVYSLVRFSPDSDSTRLYLRVEDPAENMVYANLSLGDMASYIDPDVNFDPKGNIHVLQPIALGTYLYTRANQDGKILTQEIFNTYQQIPPRLHKLDDGNVIVVGGLLENPNAPRERLSDPLTGKHPPTPAPPPAPSASPAPASSPSPASNAVP